MTSRTTRSATAQKAAEIRRAQEATERRRRNGVVVAAIVAVLVAVLGIGYAVQSGRDTTGRAATDPRGADGSVLLFGSASAPVTMDVHEDFMCPVCGAFEQQAGSTVRSLVADGTVRLRLHVRSFLDDRSTTDYSSRAGNALAVVYDTAGWQVAERFHDLLYKNQPQEGSAGLPDSRLVDLAVQAGADRAAVEAGVDDGTYDQWVVNAEDAASKTGVNQTPTVIVDGKTLDFTSGDPATVVTDAVQAADKG